MHRLLFPQTSYGRAAVPFLLLRVVAGFGLFLHGLPKAKNPFGWMGPEAAMPGVLQALAALSETAGGLALALGLLTPLAAFGVACTMAVATFTHAVQRGDPFVGKGSYELPLVYFVLALVLMLGGPGPLSVDAWLSRRLARRAPGEAPVSPTPAEA